MTAKEILEIEVIKYGFAKMPLDEYRFNMVINAMTEYAKETNKDLISALKEISEGKGRYDMDRLRHCANAVEDMQQLALDSLLKINKL